MEYFYKSEKSYLYNLKKTCAYAQGQELLQGQ
jgi:hypothetical protein